MHTIAAKAVAFGEALRPEFAAYAQQIVKNAAVLADGLKRGDLKLVTGGTSNHLVLADVYGSFGIDGKTAQERLEASGITANANAIPNDTLPPFRPSGLRLGTPAVTTRGMKENEIKQIAEWIITAIQTDDPSAHAEIKQKTESLAKSFPLLY